MIRVWLLRHLQVLFDSLGRMARSPFASLLTVFVVAVSLALPAGLYVLTLNVQRLAGGLADSMQVSVFLQPDTAEPAALELAQRLRKDPALASVEYISKEAALNEFRRRSGLGEVLGALGGNPLPPTLVLRPRAAAPDPGTLAQLGDRLRSERAVEFVQFDLDWVRRLQALLALAERALTLLAGLFALAVLLVIALTSRAAVENRRAEIEVLKLVGATDAFIRRPFLYGGALHGFFGGLIAWALLVAALAALAGPVAALTSLYGSAFAVYGPGLEGVALLPGGGGLLGWIGARFAVIGPLRRIEPA